ncbi:MAG: helix-turn-helix transcriptional regulator [Candidatus Hydrogenedentes bacterium]|nr:helix-turn-helix transcriptional regulator [Candidatus Hydrogenedentota bacterium]
MKASARMVEALASLAQETRLDAFRLLVKAGEDGMMAGDIARRLGVPAPTLSFHLAHLSHAGLIACRREGRSIIYSVRLKGFRALLDYLVEDCCQGRPELCAGVLVTCGTGPSRKIRPCKPVPAK